jgi:hypothetical protein
VTVRTADKGRRKLELYLRALYGGVDLLHHPALASMKIDRDRLEVERGARLRNLERYLRRVCTYLAQALGEQFTAHVEEFAASPAFWIARGRTLPENFCFYVHDAAGPGWLGDVARLEGALVGIATGKPSPWEGSAAAAGNPAATVEIVPLTQPVISAEGHLLAADAASGAATIEVVLDGAGKVRAFYLGVS